MYACMHTHTNIYTFDFLKLGLYVALADIDPGWPKTHRDIPASAYYPA